MASSIHSFRPFEYFHHSLLPIIFVFLIFIFRTKQQLALLKLHHLNLIVLSLMPGWPLTKFEMWNRNLINTTYSYVIYSFIIIIIV